MLCSVRPSCPISFLYQILVTNQRIGHISAEESDKAFILAHKLSTTTPGDQLQGLLRVVSLSSESLPDVPDGIAPVLALQCGGLHNDTHLVILQAEITVLVKCTRPLHYGVIIPNDPKIALLPIIPDILSKMQNGML